MVKLRSKGDGGERSFVSCVCSSSSGSSRQVFTVGKIRSPAEKFSKILAWHDRLFCENSKRIVLLFRVQKRINTNGHAPKNLLPRAFNPVLLEKRTNIAVTD